MTKIHPTAGVAWWSAQARKGARRKHAFAVVDYALACGSLDEPGHADRQRAVYAAGYHDLPGVVADLPAPRWDTMRVTAPVDEHQREFAVRLLDIAAQYGSLPGPDRRWRTIFAVRARTAGDLLVLFLDVEPHLRHRRNDPEMVAGLERLAFVGDVLRARGRGRIGRAQFDTLVERAAAGERLDVLRAELADPGTAAPTGTAPVTAPVAAEPTLEPTEVEPVTTEPVVTDQPALEPVRARIAKHLEQALFQERIDPGEHAARTVAMWSATTARELAGLVADLDELITPTHRRTALERLDRAMADGLLSLWEYETRLDVAVRARTVAELAPATDTLLPGR